MVNVVAHKKQLASYRRLLLSDWKEDLPDKVLALSWSCLSASDDEERRLLALMSPKETSFPTEPFRRLLQRIDDAARSLDLPALPDLPLDYPPVRRLNGRLPDRLTTLLALQAVTNVSGRSDFLLDLQSLAFEAAIHFALPRMRAKHADEHAVLLHALALFPLKYYTHDPGHSCYLSSALYGYLGDVDQQLRFLEAAFLFTSPEDHSYLTKAQEYWSELLDHERYDDAKRFLFSLQLRTIPAQQDEVREMMLQGLEFILAEKRQVGSSK